MRTLSRIAAVVCLLSLSFAPLAVQSNPVTPGALILQSTFESISVKAPFSGDTNANAGVSFQFRQVGTAAWFPAYDKPLIDRRATVGGAVNPYANQARVSIVGLKPDSSYEVKASWADPDNGAIFQVSGTVKTLSYNPPTGGGAIAANPSTLPAALFAVVPGQTIRLAPGTYPNFTVSRSGTAAAWIVIEGDPARTSIVSGSGVGKNISVSASFVMLKNLTLASSDSSGIVVATNRHHVFIQDNRIQNVSAKCAVNPAAHYGDAGIAMLGGVNNVFVLRNTIISTSLANPACLMSPIYSSPGEGIMWANGHTIVVADNIVKGAFRDSITVDSNFVTENVDIYRNTVSGEYRDDGVESKGGNVNVRMAGNRIETTGPGGFTCIAGNSNNATILYGPLYIFRNTCRVQNTFAMGGSVYKLGGAGVFVFHNTMDASGASVRWDGVANMTGTGTKDLVYLNNILKLKGNAIAGWTDGTLLDYNVYRQTLAGINFARAWNGTKAYSTVATFAVGTKQDSHSKQAEPMFSDLQLNLNPLSPAINAGTVLPNFNSLDSGWAYLGAGPDIGAIEAK